MHTQAVFESGWETERTEMMTNKHHNANQTRSTGRLNRGVESSASLTYMLMTPVGLSFRCVTPLAAPAPAVGRLRFHTSLAPLLSPSSAPSIFAAELVLIP
ncbi:hypothetical protein CRM22_009385 [Opisthorchis felineus]|uniref:Uncharacterized protein n=1 Tax=Opisthorchis felineus TaxID=147828 RepID=A0A4S2LEU6_OPIFE|nr:hypothetical protein CRM22_009385 [Opisthorchis felineus]